MPILSFDTVTKQFTPDSYGVRDISFSVEPGEFLFLTGPSGSGKTTLLRLLLKEYSLSSGEIFFNDTPISGIRSGQVHHHRRKIGIVFQDYKLIPELNVWENIAMPLYVIGKREDEIERRVTDLLNLIKLPEKALHFPSQLSGGEAQRVSIARSLASGPELIMADEPTGNLDTDTAHSIIRLLHKINELGTTIIIATHDQSILKTFSKNRRLQIELGKLVSDTANSETRHRAHAAETKEEASDRKPTETEKQATSEVTEPTPKSKTELQPEETVPNADEHAEHHAHSRLPWWKRWFSRPAASTQAAAEDHTLAEPELPEEAPHGQTTPHDSEAEQPETEPPAEVKHPKIRKHHKKQEPEKNDV